MYKSQLLDGDEVKENVVTVEESNFSNGLHGVVVYELDTGKAHAVYHSYHLPECVAVQEDLVKFVQSIARTMKDE